MPPSPQQLLAKIQPTTSTLSLFKAPAQVPSIPSPSELVYKTSQQGAAPSFGENLFHAGASLYQGATSALQGFGSDLKSFYTGNTKALQDIGAGKLSVTPQDVLEGTTQVGDFAGKMAQGLNEGILRIGKSMQEPLSKALPKVFTTNQENTGLTKAITGSDTTPTYQDIFARAHSYAINNNATPDQAKLFSGLVVVGALFADNPVGAPEASGVKALFKISGDAAADLARTSEESAIKAIIKKENPALSEIQLEAVAPLFREATTPEEVKVAAEQIAKVQQAPIGKPQPGNGIPTPEEVRATAEKGVVQPKYFQAIEHPQVTSELPKPESVPSRFSNVRDLLNAIGKPKTGEQGLFINRAESKQLVEHLASLEDPALSAERGVIYRPYGYKKGGNLDIILGETGLEHSRLGGGKIVAEINPDGKLTGKIRIHATPLDESAIVSRLTPREFLELGDGKNAVTPKNPKFIPVEGQPVKIAGGIDTFLHQPENGSYEVMESQTGRIVGSPGATPEEAIRSAHAALDGKSQSEIAAEIAKHPQAPKDVALAPTESPSSAVSKGFSPNLTRSIVQADSPGAIADTLKVEFPALSDRALKPIAERLSQLHRTGDIEGILRITKNVEDSVKQARAKGGSFLSPENIPKSIAIVGEHKAVADLPASLGELLTKTEASTYEEALKREVRGKEDAIYAQQEYDALWEHGDQRIIDRYQELLTYRDMMRELLGEHQGNALNNLYRGTFKSPRDVQLDELINHRKGIDTRIDEIMQNTGGDIQDAQKALNEFFTMRDQLSAVEQQIKEVAPEAKAARLVQNMIADVPVITRKYAGDIVTLTRPDDIALYKDITGFKGRTRDMYRNFEAFFGERFPVVKEVLLDRFDTVGKGGFVREINKIADDLDENIVKKFGINRGSKEDAAIQRFGDTSLPEGQRLTLDGLTREFGTKRAQDIQEADAWFRKNYNDFIDRVNSVRAKIYPNDPSKLIPKREDYYRHYVELSSGIKGLMDILEISSDSVFPHEIHPTLSGISEFTKPNAKWLSFAQQRTGKGTDISAIGGLLDYAPAFAHAVHIDPFIGEFRYLRRELANSAPVAKPLKLGETRRSTKELIGNFLSYLDAFSNDLAGKTNPLDREFQTMVPGGRATMKTIDWINSRIKANVILGNLSSSIAQIFNIPQSIASAKLYSIPGMRRTLSSIFTEDEYIKQSTFLAERFKEDLKSRFKIDWVEHPIQGTTDRGKDMAVWITQVLDEASTKFIWHSHREMATDLISKSVEGSFKLNGVPYSDSVKFADDMTRKMIAGRGIGEVALIHKSKLFQLVAPFQVEVGNSWWLQGDFIGQKAFGALAIFYITSYLMNRAAEQVRGSSVVFDPIQALVDGSVQAADEAKSGNYGRAAFKFVGRQAGEILSNMPIGQTIAAAIPDSWIQGATQVTTGAPITKKEVFGQADPGRFGSGLLLFNGFDDPLYRLLPPFGGVQVERTIGGIQSMLQGQVTDSKGQVSFKTTPTIRNVIQAFLFGKNATPEAQAFYDARNNLFNRQYGQTATRTATNLEAEKVWADVKALKTPQEKAARLKALDATNPDVADAVFNIAQSETQGLTGTDRLVGMLGVSNGERAKYIADQVRALKTPQAKVAYLKGLDEKKLIPDQVFGQVQALMAAPKDTPAVGEGTHSTSSILDTVTTYADAIGVDPVTAFNRIFTGQTIKRVDNGTIVVERMSLQASQAEAKAQGDTGISGVNGMNLDHTIPLELGGSNSKDNLKLVPEATWASYTPIENLLGEALRAKQISKQKAQELIVKFKNGELTADEVRAQIKK